MQGTVVLVTGGARGAARAAPVEARRNRQHGIDRREKSYRNMAACCGSKFAAIGITQVLAVELAPENIRVNAICRVTGVSLSVAGGFEMN